MLKRNLIYILALFLYTTSLNAQVQIDVKVDSVQLQVGEQTGITLKVTSDAGKNVSFPDLKPGM